jgi:hypothetical protein
VAARRGDRLQRLGYPQRGDFIHRTRRFEPSMAGRTGLERAYIHGHRWCDATMISELVAKGETVYPLQLGELLDEANVLADARGGAPELQLQSIR